MNEYDNLLKPILAAYIDRKLDDGYPATGIIQPFGTQSTCYKSSSGGFVYDELEESEHFGLYIKFRE